MNKKHTTLLIVDDDPDDCELFLEAVKEIDPSFNCIQASNGEDALALLHKKHPEIPDFIFLDMNMPRIDGRQFFSELKKDLHLQHIPVIIYTTSRRPEDVAEMKRMGSAGFITKPRTFEEICDAISNAITRKQIMAH